MSHDTRHTHLHDCQDREEKYVKQLPARILNNMPEISVRGLEMPESPIRKLAPLATAAKARGIKVYHLNIGQPDLPTPQVGLDALKHISRTILEY